MRVLLTGGAGYIGSHTLLEVLKTRFDAAVLDNFSNASPEALSRVKQLANADFDVFTGDIRDGAVMERAFAEFRPDAVIHFAGLKAVGESMEQPLEYYEQNLSGTVQLLRVMRKFDCRNIVFSSSATVYGDPQYLPYDEDHPTNPANTYGRTKLFAEHIIRDWAQAWPEASAVLLRYFNPVGADASGHIGEDPDGIPNNLMPYISQVAIGKLARLGVFGNDYDTRDGTGERDYIHVSDLASAHLKAIEYAAKSRGCVAINIGTGKGSTVLEMLRSFERASGRQVPYDIKPRRAGDLPSFYASATRARDLLGWRAERSIDDMTQSTWTWQSQNPKGYKG